MRVEARWSDGTKVRGWTPADSVKKELEQPSARAPHRHVHPREPRRPDLGDGHGSPHVEAFDTPGQTVAWEFAGLAGERVSFISNDTQCATHYIEGPTGTLYDGSSCEKIFSGAVTLPQAGAYRWVVDPTGAALPNETVYGYLLPPDPIVDALIAGPAVSLVIDVPGLDGSFEFEGVAGDVISATFTVPGSFGTVRFILRSPSGVELINTNTGGTPYFDRRTLTETGTYVVSVNPAGASLGTIGLRVYEVPPDLTGALVVGAAAVPFTVTTPGQNLVPTFAGTAGQSVKIITTTSQSGSSFTVLGSDGSSVFASGHRNGNYISAYFTLPTTQTYTLLVDPAGANTPTINLQIAL